MPDEMWYRAEENSRMRGEESLWIRCQFCNNPNLTDEYDPDDDYAEVGCSKDDCKHLIAWNEPYETEWQNDLLEEINKLSNDRQGWGCDDSVETLQDLPLWQTFETHGHDCLMQFLGEHHKGFLYVDQIWTNSPGSSSWGEYLFKTADYDAKAVDAELQEVKRLLEVERLENGYYDENE